MCFCGFFLHDGLQAAAGKKTESGYFAAIFFQHFIYTTNTKGDISMGKLVEGLWDCPFCGNKRIRAGQKTCPSCGHPQDENTKFYMPDEIKYVSDEEAAKTLTGSVLSAAALTAITWIHAQTVAPQKRNLNETILKCGSRKRKRSTKKKSKKHLLREAIQKNQKNLF